MKLCSHKHGTDRTRKACEAGARRKLGRIHNCGNGYTGNVVSAKGITFCGVCGKELRA